MEQLIIEILKVVGTIIAGIFTIIGFVIRNAYQTLKENKEELEERVEKAEQASLERYNEVKQMFQQEERRRTEMVDRVTSLVTDMKKDLRDDIGHLREDINRFLTPNFNLPNPE